MDGPVIYKSRVRACAGDRKNANGGLCSASEHTHTEKNQRKNATPRCRGSANVNDVIIKMVNMKAKPIHHHMPVCMWIKWLFFLHIKWEHTLRAAYVADILCGATNTK